MQKTQCNKPTDVIFLFGFVGPITGNMQRELLGVKTTR